MTARAHDLLQDGTHATRPDATAVGNGTLYACSDHGLIYQSDGAAWATWATLGGGSTALDDLSDVDTSTTAPATNDVLTFDGAVWGPAAASGGGGSGESSWTAATYLNGWVSAFPAGGYNPAGYRKDASGVVHLRGLVANSASLTDSTVFSLPVGYRPSGRAEFATIRNDALGRLQIRSTGEVVVIGSGVTTYISLDPAIFYAA